jgi:hypothetical protein
MRSVYALIPAALLAGSVIVTSAEAKASRVADAEAHRLSWNARQKTFLSNTKVIAAKTPEQLSKAHSRKPLNLASTKPRLVHQEAHKTARVSPVIEAVSNAATQEAIVTPKAAIIASMPMTKTLRSGPREMGRPFVLARLSVSQSRIKPNETTDTAYVLDSFESSRLLMASPHGLHCALPVSNPALILMLADLPARSASTNLSAIRRGSWASWANVMS